MTSIPERPGREVALGHPGSTYLTVAAGKWLLAGIAIALLATSVARTRAGSFVDFQSYYQAAVTVRQGEALYAHALRWRDASLTIALPGGAAIAAEVSPPAAEGISVVGLSPYVYPPGLAVALIPLTFLPFGVASALWLGLLVASIVGTVYLVSAIVIPRASGWSRLLTVLVVTGALAIFGPSRISLLFGQTDLLLLFLATLSWSAFSSGRDYRAGLWLGLAVAIKPTLAFLMLVFLWKRAYRAFIATGVASAAAVLLPVVLVGPGAIADFIAVARYWGSPQFDVTPINQSPNGLFLRLFTENPFSRPLVDAPLLATSFYLGVVAITLFIVARHTTRTRTTSALRTILEFGLALVAMLIVAPLSEDLHYVYAAIPLMGLMWFGLRRSGWSGVSMILGALVLAALWSLPGLRRFEFPTEPPVAMPELMLTGAYAYVLVALGALTVGALRAGKVVALAPEVPREPNRLQVGPTDS
jgi:Glycosyltransferase family 87